MGNVEHGKKPGQEPYLNVEEEKDLAKFVEVVADIGFGKTRKQIKAMVGSDGFWNVNPSLLCERVIALQQLEWMP